MSFQTCHICNDTGTIPPFNPKCDWFNKPFAGQIIYFERYKHNELFNQPPTPTR